MTMSLRRYWPLILALLLAACGQPDAAPLAAPTPASPPASAAGPPSTALPQSMDIANVLRARPAPGQSVEVDAYFSGLDAPLPSLPSVPRPPPEYVSCPFSSLALTDQPFRAFLQVLNGTYGNPLPDDAPWLIATTPEATQPGKLIFPQLPYHARLRGHFGELAFAKCDHADRIFVVEAVIKVYEQQPPGPPVYPMKPPADYAAWPRYHDDANGYSLPYPADWRIERVDDATLVLRTPQWPTDPVTVRVYNGTPATEPYSGGGVFEQSYVFNGALTTQRLAGYTIDREPGPGTRTVTVLLSDDGRTYELSLTFPTGFDAPQPLLTDYSAIVAGFRLDTLPTTPLQAPAGFLPPPTAPAMIAPPMDTPGPSGATETPPTPPPMPPTFTPGPSGAIETPTFAPWPPTDTPAPTEARLGPTATPAPFPGTFQLTLVATPSQGTAPLTIKLGATITGDPDNSEVLYCPSQLWDFGDGQIMQTEPDCVAWSPDAHIPRQYATEYRYEHPGTYEVRLRLNHGPFGLLSNIVTIMVR